MQSLYNCPSLHPFLTSSNTDSCAAFSRPCIIFCICSMCVFVRVCVCVYIYIYIYTHTHTHTHTHIYIYIYYDRTTVHRNRFLVNKTNRCTKLQFYWYYYSTCFGQPFCPSLGVLSHTRNRMELKFHPTPGSKRFITTA